MLKSIKHPITGEVFDLTKCAAPEIGVPPGRIVIFAGPTACGKTTMLDAVRKEGYQAGFRFLVQDELERHRDRIDNILPDANKDSEVVQCFFAVEDAKHMPKEYAGCIIHMERGSPSWYGADYLTDPSKLTVLRPEDAGEVPDVVELLEAALVRARKGEIYGVAVITVNNLRSISTAYSIGSGSCADLHFGAATLQARLLATD